ncbi:MAG: hypothetical protein E7167_01230 [Firmicutes bacterium]|nr:hypothetical protein [Bacillota bacterium]
MVKVKCSFYMKNGMTISAIATIDSQEELDEEIEKKQEHFENVWFHDRKGIVGWGNTTIKSEECIGYNFEIVEEFEEEDSIEPVSVDDILKGAFFNG